MSAAELKAAISAALALTPSPALRQQLARPPSAAKSPGWEANWIAHVELARDKFLPCCYTSLRISDANRAAWRDVRGNLLVLAYIAKSQVTVCISFFDNDLLVPKCYRANGFLKVA